MKVYFLVCIITFLAQFVTVKDDKQYLKRTIISFIPLFLFMALRKDYGVDDDAYHEYYNLIQRTDNIFSVNEHMGVGYAIFNKIMPSYQLLIAVISALVVWSYVYVIYKYVPKNFSWLAVLLILGAPSLTVFFAISGLRNAIAAAMAILSTPLIVKRKWWWVIAIGALAMTFHQSAFVIFSACYLVGNNKPLNKKMMVAWGIVLVVFGLGSLSTMAQDALPIVDFFMSNYVHQVEGLAEVADERGITGTLAGLTFGGGILAYLLLMGNDKRLTKSMSEELGSEKYKFALLFAASFTLGMLGGRMVQYWIYFFAVAVTCMVAYWKNPAYKVVYLLLVLFYYRVTYMSWVNSLYFPYYEYSSILGNF